MNWYLFDSMDHFNTWHDSLCESLGYPLISVNQATNLPDPNVQNTTIYTMPILCDSKIIAFIEEKYAQGLKITTEPIFTLE